MFRAPVACLVLVAATTILAACGGGSDGDTDDPPGSSVPTLASRAAAARSTAESAGNACAAIRPFYWETGDAGAALASGSVASPSSATRYAADTAMDIASASKWIYGSYVVQKRAGLLTPTDVRFLTLSSGYTSFEPSACPVGGTVRECHEAGDNDRYRPTADGKFFYEGSHMQAHAAAEGLGALADADLSAEVRRVLGSDIALANPKAWLAGGFRTTPGDYARLLRGILSGRLAIGQSLGAHAVCTNPATCPTALFTPVPDASWSYAIGHWVESDPIVGDGAFSSAGAYGFYPWIDAGRRWYGIVARDDRSAGRAGWDSALCGQQIRQAWQTAIAR